MRTTLLKSTSVNSSASLFSRLSPALLSAALLAWSSGSGLAQTPATPRALFVYAGATMPAGDLAISNRLATLGYRVQAVLDTASATAQAATNDLIVISSSVGSGNLVASGAHKFLSSTVPVINWESANLDDLRMTSTAAGRFGTQGSQTSVNIVRANHPLAGGRPLGTNVIFNSAQTVQYGVPLANAIVIARQVGNDSRGVLFAYERDDVLFGGTIAAERRIALPLETASFAAANTNGIALFDAAVRWANPTSPAPVFVSEPADATVAETRSVSFTCEVNGARPFTFQWLKNNTAIAGETSRSLTLSPALSDNGATISVRVTNASGNITSRAAKLTVTEDKSAPAIVSVTGSSSFTDVTIKFSKPLLPATATNRPNYAFFPAALGITGARLSADRATVVLTTTPQTPGATYTLRVFSVRDATAAVTSIAPGTEVSFSAWVLSRGALLSEAFNDIGGNTVADLIKVPKFVNNQPDSTRYITSFDTRTDDVPELMGERVSGYYTPPANGLYRFFIRSDDASQLFMNTNSVNSTDPSRKVLIAKEDACCNAYGSTAAGGPRVSPDISLTAGQRYYIEALLKEGTGGDYVQVAVREKAVSGNPPNTEFIPGVYLSSFANPDGAAITITEQPQSVTAAEGGGASVTFRVVATGVTLTSTNHPIAYQWQRNGVDIIGANGSSYTTAAAPSNNGAKYRALLMIPGKEALSQEATLTVTPDTTAPSLISANTYTRQDKLTVAFSEPVSVATATKIDNYKLNNGVRITAVDRTAQNTVDLTVTAAPEPTSRPSAVPLMEFHFDEGTGTTVKSKDGKLTGAFVGTPTFTNDTPSGLKGDFSLRFAAGQRVSVPEPNKVLALDPNDTSFTVQAWLKFTTPTARSVFFYNNGPGGAVSASVFTNRTAFVTTLGIVDQRSNAAIPNDGGWHHMAVVHDATLRQIRFYVDGALGDTVSNYTRGVIFTRTNQVFYIGSEPTGGLQYVGQIDRLRYSKGVVLPTELDSHPVPPADTIDVTLVPLDANHKWRYENTGKDLGAGWREKNFDDKAWPEGAALLAAESDPTTEPIRTQLTRRKPGSTANNIVTDYFRTHFNFSGDPKTVRLNIRHIVDDGFVLYLNGKEVYRIRVAAGQTAATTAENHEEDYEGPFDIPTDALIVGDNVLAAEVHNQSATSSDTVFGLELKAVVPAPPSGGFLTGLLGYWRMDETDGDIVSDSSGKGNNGKVINNPKGVWVEDVQRGRVFRATGESVIDFGTIIPVMTATSDFTWSLWVKSDETDNNNIVLGNRYRQVTGGAGVDFTPREFIKFTPRQFEWQFNGTGQNVNYTDFVVGQWTHHVVVKKGNTLTYYRDGAQANTGAITGAPTNKQSLSLGGQATLERWRGLADDVAIFERALSAVEVQQFYGQGKLLERPAPPALPTDGLRLTINGVQDLAEKPNIIAANAQLIVKSDAAAPAEFGQLLSAYQDDFNGTALNPNWKPRGATLNLYTVTNGVLRVVAGAGDPNHLLYEAPGYNPTNQEVLARIRLVTFGANDNSRAGIAVAVQTNTADLSRGINWHFRDANHAQVNTINGRQLRFLDDLRQWGPGYDFRPVGPNRWVTNAWYWLRLKHEPNTSGSAIDASAKVWLADGTVPEPDWQATWNYVPSGSSPTVRSGFAGIAASVNSGVGTFDVDYVLIKADGLSTIKAGGSDLAPKAALLVTGATPSAGDGVVSNRLVTLGYKVTSVTAPAVTTGHSSGKSVIVVSSTVSSGDMLSGGVHKFRDTAVPLMNYESANYDDLGMTGTASTEFGTTATQTSINIVSAGHPLAGGLPAGTNVIFTSAQTTTWGIPLPNAIVIARPVGNNTQAVIFGYEQGDELFGGRRAAERRLGFVLNDASPTAANAATAALFDAAIRWLDPEDPTLVIARDPADTSVTENQTATFSVEPNGARPFSYQWLKNNAAIADATGRSLSTQVAMSDNGALFTVRVTGPIGTVTSKGAKLTVVADKVPPTVLSAATRGNPNGVTVVFSKPVADDTALNPANYSISGGINVFAAGPGRDSRSVVLTTAGIPEGRALTLTIKDVTDRSAVPNKIAPNPTTVSLNTSQGLLAFLAFNGIPGNSVADLINNPKFRSGQADEILFMSSFNTRSVYPNDSHEGYGAWIAGYYVAPSNGVYRFFIRSDDASQLWMSTNNASSEDPTKKVLIAREDACCNNYGATAAGGPRVSPNIAMNAGQKYWVEAYLKEGTGGDFFQAAVRERAVTGNPPNTESIPGEQLSSPINSGAVEITAHPVTVTAAESQSASFTVAAAGTPPYGYQWYNNGVAIAGANGPSYTIPRVTFAHQTSFYSALVTNAFSVAASDGASVKVLPDTTPPIIVSVSGGPTLTEANVTFNEPLDPASANNAANYSVAGLKVAAAKLGADGQTVVLTTGPQQPGIEYTVTAKGVKDSTSGGNAANSSGRFTSWVPASGYLLREVYSNIGGGNTVADLTSNPKFPNSPDIVDLLPTFEGPTNFAEAFGERISGFITAPETGNYVFFLATDDGGSLFLSTDESPSSKRLIAVESSWSNARQWVTSGGSSSLPSKRSDQFVQTEWPTGNTISLVAGKRYYVEVLHKEGGGGDVAGVTWKLPSQSAAVADNAPPIAGQYLSTAANPAGAQINFQQQPQSVAVSDGNTVTLAVAAQAITRVSKTQPIRYQWQRNGANVPGATNASFTTPPLKVADTATYRAVLSIPGAVAASQDAVVTVTRDTIAPTLVSASSYARTDRVSVVFSEAVSNSATNAANYTINNNITVRSVTRASANSVDLTTTALAPGPFYVLTVNGVQDVAGNPIRIRSRILIDTNPAVPSDFGLVVNGYQDDFTAPALNPNWKARGPSPNIYSLTNGALRVVSAAGDPNHLVYEGPYSSTTQEVLARIRVLQFGTGDPARAGIGTAVNTNSQGINLHFRDLNQNAGGVSINGRHIRLLDDNRAWGPGFDFRPVGTNRWTTNTWYWLRLRHEVNLGTGQPDAFGKAWLADGTTPEPSDWQVRWDIYPAAAPRTGFGLFAGITGGSINGISVFEVDYVLIKAEGLPGINVESGAFALLGNRGGRGDLQLLNTRPVGAGNTVVLADENEKQGLSIIKIEDGIVVQFPASPGRAYKIQASSDLKTWTDIGSATGNAQGRGQFLDPDSTYNEQRFYRTLSP